MTEEEVSKKELGIRHEMTEEELSKKELGMR
jgi:hypothetical protein